MNKRRLFNSNLGLRSGDWVEVKSAEELLATLDDRGSLDALPFMPEMLKYCGQRMRVYKRADKTCDTIEYSGSRRMFNTVHLEGSRCNGSAHGGCQAGCLLFWKEAWLRRVDDVSPKRCNTTKQDSRMISESALGSAVRTRCGRTRLMELTRVMDPGEKSEPLYRCQATELRRASVPLRWWDLRQYVRDVQSGNVKLSNLVEALLFRLLMKVIRVGGYRALIFLHDTIQRRRGGIPFPFKWGVHVKKTPREVLDLKPGELVQVKSHEEILKTLDTRNRNHGLSFDVEMVKYCGGTYRVLDRVERIVDEKTGKMIELPNDCVILDGVVCGAHFSHQRLFCPRSLYPFWREIWLKRVS